MITFTSNDVINAKSLVITQPSAKHLTMFVLIALKIMKLTHVQTKPQIPSNPPVLTVNIPRELMSNSHTQPQIDHAQPMSLNSTSLSNQSHITPKKTGEEEDWS